MFKLLYDDITHEYTRPQKAALSKFAQSCLSIPNQLHVVKSIRFRPHISDNLNGIYVGTMPVSGSNAENWNRIVAGKLSQERMSNWVIEAFQTPFL